MGVGVNLQSAPENCSSSDPHVHFEIRVRGRVQGVGFRPTVWRYARELGLSGEVLNDSSGVLIRAFGSKAHGMSPSRNNCLDHFPASAKSGRNFRSIKYRQAAARSRADI